MRSLLLLAWSGAAAAGDVTISNTIPRKDSSGAIMDAHDSKLIQVNGEYMWFAASYGDCKEPAGSNGCAGLGVGKCGFQTDHNVTLFTSTDLVSWQNKGVVFSAAGNLPPNSVLFAPKTVFNPQTKQYVMWFNYIVNSFGNSFYGVATSPTPTGPFSMKVANVSTLVYADNGDENLFVDTDGTGYLIYTSLSLGHKLSIERLTPDFLGTQGKAGSSGVVASPAGEAPAMFKRNGVYYIAYGNCCCYCGGGSAITVYTATSPLGPYTSRTSLGDLHSQATDIFSYTDAAGAEQFMYIGDHWQSSPDGLKSHDFTVWAPLQFSADGLSVTTGGFQSNFTVSVSP